MMTLWKKFSRAFGAFRSDRAGNVMITFALATLPIVGTVGFAVDYSHANSVRAAMQAAIDSTALMLSKEAATDTASQVQTNAQKYFNALFTRPEATGVTITATYTTTDGSQVLVNGSANVPTTFLGVIGYQNIPISTTSTVKWGSTRLRVALALDTTGSMSSDGKIGALKTATKNLLDQLKSVAAKNGDVYVSIIPFSKDVNVDKWNYDKNWVRWDLWEAKNGKCSKSDYHSKSDCESNGKKWIAANHDLWNGCVTDRDKDFDTTNTAPTITNNATLFPAEQYGSCPKEMMGLSYDWQALKAKADSRNPSGMTNQGIGIQWAFQSLTASPFTIPPKDPNYKYSEVIILMSDGLNTQNRYSSKQSDIDAREAITCTNAKKAGITIYTVQVNTGGDPTQQVMKNCASDSSKFFELKQANQLVTTFNSIGTALSNLRVAK